MKALLLKDCLTLAKTLRTIVVIMLIVACIPTLNMSVFFMVYCVMMPVNAMAYDERTKWDALSAMMPYRPWQPVISKYILGYGILTLLTLLAMLAMAVYNLVIGTPLTLEPFLMTGLYAAITTIVLSIILPLVFRFGVEKGRLVLAIGFGAGVAIYVGLIAPLSQNMGIFTLTFGQMIAVVIGFTLLANALSILLSMRIYRRKLA